jgi:TatD DNase family protein
MKNDYWIDTHTHLNMLKEQSPKEAIEAAKLDGVKKFINIGTDSKDHPIVLGLAKSHPEVYCTLGVHPHDAEDFENAKDFMLDNLSFEKVVAVGEIGLDFYYDHAPRELQKSVFRRQMEIAEQHNLPVQIHTRDAEDETIEVLEEFRGRVDVLLHCFSGSRKLAEKAVELGCHFSLSGILTFKSADSLRETISEVIPVDRIHMETDAPFLAPVPKRGKENHPALMIHTAQKVAELKGLTLEELREVSTANNLNLFPKLKNEI